MGSTLYRNVFVTETTDAQNTAREEPPWRGQKKNFCRGRGGWLERGWGGAEGADLGGGLTSFIRAKPDPYSSAAPN